MNVENFHAVANVIEANKEHFNLNYFLDDCNTTACVAGWCYILSKREHEENKFKWLDGKVINLPSIARDFLDISSYQATRLFYAHQRSVWIQYAEKYDLSVDHHGICNWSSVPAEMAIEILRDIADGKVKL